MLGKLYESLSCLTGPGQLTRAHLHSYDIVGLICTVDQASPKYEDPTGLSIQLFGKHTLCGSAPLFVLPLDDPLGLPYLDGPPPLLAISFMVVRPGSTARRHNALTSFWSVTHWLRLGDLYGPTMLGDTRKRKPGMT